MTIQEIYEFCLNVVNKDTQGIAFSPTQFNNMAAFVNLELYIDTVAKTKATDKKLSEAVFEVGDLRNFIATSTLTLAQSSMGGLTLGLSPYPDDMEFPISLWSSGRDVEIVTPYKLSRIRSSVVNRNFEERPVAVTVDGNFEFYPNDLSNLLLTYLKRPTTPYYDYCTNQSDVVVFMPVGSYIQYNLTMGVYNLYDTNGVLLESDVIHPYFGNLSPNPTIPYNSLTTEFEWADTRHLYLANRILERMGVNLRAPEVAQYAQAK